MLKIVIVIGGYNMAKVYLKKPTVNELGYRQDLLEKRDDKNNFPENVWNQWAQKWLSDDKNYFYAYVKRKKDGMNVGEVSYYFDLKEGMPLVSVFIESLYRRNYYGQEAISLLLDKCLQKQKFDQVAVKFQKDNEVLNKFFTKLGFKLYKEDDNFMFSKITKDDYQIKKYIDEKGIIRKIPVSLKIRNRLVAYMATKFVFGQLYSDRAFLKIIADNSNSKDHKFFKQQLLELGYITESYDKSKFERIK
ncbi:MAG: GNAT family N-acetyltransferase [Erysipelotrichaceae bacterium]|nr:GNAT family N-acetyltransferase [Erysipelotrichaceae bacterium]